MTQLKFEPSTPRFGTDAITMTPQSLVDYPILEALDAYGNGQGGYVILNQKRNSKYLLLRTS